MSDMTEGFNAMKGHKGRLRARYGVGCPECKKHRPRACATILLPQQRCRVDGYVDPRPELTDAEWGDA
ncbi:hypothetical protein CSQ90_26715 [Janthinobacterium sp. BJB303]|nr:hypothetical protein CSQ90_26715 [Janthinobacterium sp. BJB303]